MKRDSHLETSAVLKVRRLTLLWTHAPPPHLVHGVVFCLSPFLQILFSTPPTHTYAHTSRTLHAPQLLQWWWSARSNCAPLQGGAHGVDGGAACAASWGAPNPVCRVEDVRDAMLFTHYAHAYTHTHTWSHAVCSEGQVRLVLTRWSTRGCHAICALFTCNHTHIHTPGAMLFAPRSDPVSADQAEH
eukprot:1137023-Pelagomonas_calceolata.AAC.1